MCESVCVCLWICICEVGVEKIPHISSHCEIEALNYYSWHQTLFFLFIFYLLRIWKKKKGKERKSETDKKEKREREKQTNKKEKREREKQTKKGKKRETNKKEKKKLWKCHSFITSNTKAHHFYVSSFYIFKVIYPYISEYNWK